MAPPPVTRVGAGAGAPAVAPGAPVTGRTRALAGEARRAAGPLVRAGALVVIAVALERVLLRAAALPEAAYRGGFFPAAQLRTLAASGPEGIAALGAAAVLLAAALRARSLGPSWHDLEHGGRLRVLVGATAALLAWVFATYDYNFYFDRVHAVERALLVALAALVVWRPAFTLPFLAVLLPVGAQFVHPIGGFSWAPYHVPVRLLFLFAAWWLLRLGRPRVHAADLLYVASCMIAAHYWVSGWEKLRLGWLALDHIGFLLGSTWANGWLGFLSPETIGRTVRALLAANVPLKAATLLIECGALVALLRPVTLRAFLAGAIALHLAILAMTGIAFWWWIAVNALLLALFLRRRGPPLPVFDRPHFLASLILIGGGALWFRPVPLAWLDARATYTYRVEATDATGATVALTPAFFAPYDYQLTLGAFRYLVDAPRLPIAWGAVRDPDIAAALNRTTTSARILELERTYGRNEYDAERAERFDAFLRRFLGAWQASGGRGRWPPPLQAPATLWTFPRSLPAPPSSALERAVVHEVLSFFDGEGYVTVRRTPVRTVRLDGYTPATIRR